MADIPTATVVGTNVVAFDTVENAPKNMRNENGYGFDTRIVARRDQGYFEKLIFQIKLLLWKRFCELTKNRISETFKNTFPPMLFFALIILFYYSFPFLGNGNLEPYLVPVAFWYFIQKSVVNIMYEKQYRLQESMRMMGLLDSAYWISYFISDGIIIGFVQSFLCAILSTYGLFNKANFGVVLGLLYVFSLAAVGCLH